jgi:hypothetical protein
MGATTGREASTIARRHQRRGVVVAVLVVSSGCALLLLSTVVLRGLSAEVVASFADLLIWLGFVGVAAAMLLYGSALVVSRKRR